MRMASIMKRAAGAALIVGLAGQVAVAADATLPLSVMTEGTQAAQCDEEIKADSAGETGDLGDGQLLVEVRCWRAAYQAGSIFFVMTAAAPDKARLLRFPEPPKKGGFTPVRTA